MISTDLMYHLEDIVQLAYERGTPREELIRYVNGACDDVDRQRAELAEEEKKRG